MEGGTGAFGDRREGNGRDEEHFQSGGGRDQPLELRPDLIPHPEYLGIIPGSSDLH